MKQLLQYMKTGETRVVEVPEPTPQRGEALVRNAASLVSAGTERMLVEFAEKTLLGKVRSRPDLARQVLDKARREGVLSTLAVTTGRLDQPISLGYSSAGTIIGLGPGITGFEVGQRVACAGGGFAVHAEVVSVPSNLLTPLPDLVGFESGAFTTLGAIALHGFRLAEVQVGEIVAVIGLGLLGQLMVQIAQAAGCRVYGVDLDPNRVELAKSLDAEAVHRDYAQDGAVSFTHGRGCDAVLICADSASSDPIELAGQIARDRARIIAVGAVGLQVPRKLYYEKELTLLNSRSYGPGRYDPRYEEDGVDYPIGYVRWTEGRNLEAFVEMLSRDRVDVKPLISHRFTIEHAPQAYELITGKGEQNFLGVLLTYPEGGSADHQLETTKTVHIHLQTLDSPSSSSSNSGVVSLGVLGAGNFAQAVLLPALKKVPGLEKIGVASASGMNARHAADRFGFRYATSDETEIIDDPNISTVAVLTRHNLHAAQVIAALNSGKHVFCEKPLAINEDELNEIWTVLQAAQTLDPPPLLMVGYNRRFAPLGIEMKEFIGTRVEPLFAHYRVNAGFLPLTHWLHDPIQGGGRIIGEACHFIDFLTYLVGAVPVRVTAQGLPDAKRYREDNVVLTFGFPDGSLGMLSYVANGDKGFPKERLEVFSSGKVAVLDDFRSLEMFHQGKRRKTVSRLQQDKGHHAEWLAFNTAICQAQVPPIPYDHLFGVTLSSFKALEALRIGDSLPINFAPTNIKR